MTVLMNAVESQGIGYKNIPVWLHDPLLKDNEGMTASMHMSPHAAFIK